MDWFTIQYSLDSVKQWCNGTLALMLADYLRDRHSTYTIHWWGYLVSHCMPNLLWERDKTRYICIYIQITDWVSCMAYPFSLLRLLFCIEVGLIVIHSIYKTLMKPSIFFSIKFHLILKIFTIFHDLRSLLQKGP